MKAYINPTTYVVDIQTENVILSISSGGDGPVKGVTEDPIEGGNRVPLRYLF